MIQPHKKSSHKTLFISLCMPLLLCKTLYADPWFTGPILAGAGTTVPAGHTNLEIYSIFLNDKGRFDRHTRTTPTPAAHSNQYTAIFGHGLTNHLDIQFSFPYLENRQEEHEHHGVGDMQAALGYQVLKQTSVFPDLRAVVMASIPTGRYEQLNPSLIGTDATGRGSYKATYNLNFQYLAHPFADNYLRTRLILSYTYTYPALVTGHNHFGGEHDTNAHVYPGGSPNADLAMEFSVTQNWVAVMEAYYYTAPAARVTGNPGTTALGLPANIGRPGNSELSFAPAIEYNFSANYGIIAGVWYSQQGSKTAPSFNAPVVAFNAFW